MNNNKQKTDQTKKNENGRTHILITLNNETHQVLILESLQSRTNGKKKNLPEIIEDRLVRDLKTFPVSLQG